MLTANSETTRTDLSGCPTSDATQRPRNECGLCCAPFKVTFDKDGKRCPKNIEKLKEHGVETNRGIILAGPPGVGKSMTLDALMSASESTVILAKTKAMHKVTIGGV